MLTERASNVTGGLRFKVGGNLTPMAIIGMLAVRMSKERRRAGRGGGALGSPSLAWVAFPYQDRGDVVGFEPKELTRLGVEVGGASTQLMWLAKQMVWGYSFRDSCHLGTRGGRKRDPV